MDLAYFPVLTDADMQLPLYLTSVGRWAHQEPILRPEGFPSYQFHHVISGEGELTVADRQWTVKAGQSFCLHPHHPHRYESTQPPWSVYWVSFGGWLAGDMLKQADMDASGAYALEPADWIAAQMQRMLDLSQSAVRPDLAAELSKRLYDFLLDLRLHRSQSPVTAQNRTRLQPVLRYIADHLHRPLTLEELAWVIGVSPQHLCTLFRRILGLRPMALVNRERIQRSKQLMFRDPAAPIREIALRVGIDSPSYFGMLFKRWEGQSPEQFKRMHGLKG